MSPSSPYLCIGGVHVFRIALRQGSLREVWCTEAIYRDLDEKERRFPAIRIVSREELTQRFGEEGKARIVSLVELPPLQDVERLVEKARSERLPLLLLEELQDPQNLGSIARAAYNLGCAGIVLTRHRTAPRSPAAFRASSGYLLLVPCAEVGGAASFLLKMGEFPSYATVTQGGIAPWEAELKAGHLLVLGREGEGLKPLTLARCRYRITIPMERAGESLNVAQSAAILLYEAKRQRLQEGGGQ